MGLNHKSKSKGRKNKKKRISKHVLHAQHERSKKEQEADKQAEGVGGSSTDVIGDAFSNMKGMTVVNPAMSPASRKKYQSSSSSSTAIASPQSQQNNNRNNNKVKDPSEAASYLSSWQAYNQLSLMERQQQQEEESSCRKTTTTTKTTATTTTWKFHKNTQSWLLRHMYDSTLVNKTMFLVLLDYMKGLRGKTRVRVKEDATRRALRYKEWEKSKQQQQQQEKGDGLVDDYDVDELNKHQKDEKEGDDHNDKKGNNDFQNSDGADRPNETDTNQW